MRKALLLAVLAGACAAPTWRPPDSQWQVELGMTLEELHTVWPGGLGQVMQGHGRTVEVLWLYSVLQPVLLEDERVVGWAIGNLNDAGMGRAHPDLVGFDVGSSTERVRGLLGEPSMALRFENAESHAIELWSYGRERPRYVFVEYPSSEEATLVGLAVGFEGLR